MLLETLHASKIIYCYTFCYVSSLKNFAIHLTTINRFLYLSLLCKIKICLLIEGLYTLSVPTPNLKVGESRGNDLLTGMPAAWGLIFSLLIIETSWASNHTYCTYRFRFFTVCSSLLKPIRLGVSAARTFPVNFFLELSEYFAPSHCLYCSFVAVTSQFKARR